MDDRLSGLGGSRGEGGYRSETGDGAVESALTGLQQAVRGGLARRDQAHPHLRGIRSHRRRTRGQCNVNPDWLPLTFRGWSASTTGAIPRAISY